MSEMSKIIRDIETRPYTYKCGDGCCYEEGVDVLITHTDDSQWLGSGWDIGEVLLQYLGGPVVWHLGEDEELGIND